MSSTNVMIEVSGPGNRPDAWQHQVDALPAGFQGVAVEIPDLTSDRTTARMFSLATASADVLAGLDRRGIQRAHLCGLSLGAMIAFRIAVDQPERVRSLVLAAGQVKPPRVLMAIPEHHRAHLPEKLLAPDGISKAQKLAVIDAVDKTDFSGELSSVAAPTLVLCGSKDRANLPAARTFARGIPDAELQIIDGAGHQSNTQAPDRFSALLNEFLTRNA